jgi:hypothetical protein
MPWCKTSKIFSFFDEITINLYSVPNKYKFIVKVSVSISEKNDKVDLFCWILIHDIIPVLSWRH